MSNAKTLGTPARSTIRTALLVGGLILAGAASAQSHPAPDRATSEAALKNAATTKVTEQHDPFSPFVYDALGATPALRLPFLRNAAPASKQAETKERDTAREEPAVSAAVQRAEAVSR